VISLFSNPSNDDALPFKIAAVISGGSNNVFDHWRRDLNF
jgi:hypothetical protein